MTFNRIIVGLMLVALLITPTSGLPRLQQPASAASANGIQEGISFPAWWSGVYADPGSDLALADLQTTGAEWVSVIATGYLADHSATSIDYASVRTPTDADLAHVINRARSQGLKVMLKPHVDLQSETPSDWRGMIGDYYTTEAQWNAWFASYRTFILHYAQLAQQLGVEQFCVGTELLGTTRRRPNDWRALVAAVRTVYSGKLTYAALHTGEESSITWWDTLDYIGVDAYYPLHDDPSHSPTLAELEASWLAPIARMSALSAAWNKPIILTEVGYRSQVGCTVHPFDSTTVSPLCEDEQFLAYTALFKQVYRQAWLGGIYLWSWDPNRFKSGACDDSYNPYDKPAEQVITGWYGGQPPQGNTAVPATIGEVLYNNSLVNGWQDGSWGGTVIYNASDYVYAGSYSIRASLSAASWGAIALTHASIDLSNAQWLQFYIRAQNTDAVNLQLVFEKSDGSRLAAVPVNDCRFIDGGTIKAGTWKRVLVPLEAFGLPGAPVSKLIIQYMGGAGDSATFWVDEISLLPAQQIQYDETEFMPFISVY